MHSVDVYRRLEAEAEETGRSPGWREVGSLRLASTPERLDELRRQHGWAKTFGLPMELLSPDEAHELFPLMDPDGRARRGLAADRRLPRPERPHLRLARRRPRRWASTVETGVRVTDLVVEHGRVRRVVTDHGDVEAETVVAACGMYTPQVAALAGVNVPIVPMAHQYLITRAIDGVTAGPAAAPRPRQPRLLPAARAAGCVLGGYERDPAPWSVDGVPDDFNNRLLPEDWDRFAPLMTLACRRVPAVEERRHRPAGQRARGVHARQRVRARRERGGTGSSWPPGSAPTASPGAGGVGRVMAEWILDGEPGFDTWKMDIRRFGAQYRSRDLRGGPHRRGLLDLLRHPLPERGAPGRAAAAALARLRRAWPQLGLRVRREERVGAAELVRARTSAARRRVAAPRGWAGEHWSPAIGAEALACRDRPRCSTRPASRRWRSTGPGAAAFLSRICANDVDRAIGSVTYTQLLNDRGGIECDLTATRLADDRYLLVTGTAFGKHDLGWIHKQQAALPEGDGVHGPRRHRRRGRASGCGARPRATCSSR